jgi:hypothetical protein
VRVTGVLTYVYRAINSAGETIDFMLSPKRDAVAAKYFLQMALWRAVQVRLRVVNVDGHAANPLASGTKQKRRTRSRVPVSAVSVANKVLEQNHRFVKKRIAASLWFRSVDDLRTIQAYEATKMIRKGLVSWLAKADIVGQVEFLERSAASARVDSRHLFATDPVRARSGSPSLLRRRGDSAWTSCFQGDLSAEYQVRPSRIQWRTTERQLAALSNSVRKTRSFGETMTRNEWNLTYCELLARRQWARSGGSAPARMKQLLASRRVECVVLLAGRIGDGTATDAPAQPVAIDGCVPGCVID